jgi:hypothetical protein
MNCKSNLVALAIGVALAAPAMAQDSGAAAQVGAGVQAQTQTPVPDPVPPANPETGQGRSAQGAIKSATQGDASAMQPQAAPPGQSQPTADANAASQSANGLTWNTVDTDKDGKLSASEVSAYAGLKANFSGMDGNSDGFVTQDEYRAYAQARRQPAGKP